MPLKDAPDRTWPWRSGRPRLQRLLRRGCIGRIYETRTGPADLRWFWALYAPSKLATLRTDNRTATLEQAKAKFEASWKQWKACAGMEEVG